MKVACWSSCAGGARTGHRQCPATPRLPGRSLASDPPRTRTVRPACSACVVLEGRCPHSRPRFRTERPWRPSGRRPSTTSVALRPDSGTSSVRRFPRPHRCCRRRSCCRLHHRPRHRHRWHRQRHRPRRRGRRRRRRQRHPRRDPDLSPRLLRAPGPGPRSSGIPLGTTTGGARRAAGGRSNQTPRQQPSWASRFRI